MYKKKELSTVFAIVIAATIVRVLFLWVGRPQFVGWFNHTYYYYVETKGLLETGVLPYPDMPLLFYLYALTAKMMSWLGIPTDIAIVSATRFWMCIIPSLIPIPVYLTIKNISQNRINLLLWVVIGVSAFLPLTILHLPEFSQKNVVGLLLMATALLFTKKLLVSFNFRQFAVLALLFGIILLTHFGTAGVALLLALSIIVALLVTNGITKAVIKYAVLLFSGFVIAIAAFYLIDPQRFDRIFHYLSESLSASFLAVVFSANSDVTQRVTAIISVLIPILVTGFFYFGYRNYKSALPDSDKVFWLSQIIFFYLLFLPVYDQLLLARFSLFASLPALFILTYLLENANWKPWIKKALVFLMAGGTLLLIFGEFMSLKMHNSNKEEVYEDLLSMNQKIAFEENDLILTKNGAEHICNWFLGTKAGVITSLHLSDFEKYQSIYILNPIEGQLNFQDLEGKKADNETDRYLFMMRNIPKPQNAQVVYQSEYIELSKLESPPEEWEFNTEGYWMSY